MTAGRGTARAADGHELAVTRFPAQGEAIGSVLVAGAMGVRQDFYAPLARFLADGASEKAPPRRPEGADASGNID